MEMKLHNHNRNIENQVEFGCLAKLGGKFYESCWVRAFSLKPLEDFFLVLSWSKFSLSSSFPDRAKLRRLLLQVQRPGAQPFLGKLHSCLWQKCSKRDRNFVDLGLGQIATFTNLTRDRTTNGGAAKPRATSVQRNGGGSRWTSLDSFTSSLLLFSHRHPCDYLISDSSMSSVP